MANVYSMTQTPAGASAGAAVDLRRRLSAVQSKIAEAAALAGSVSVVLESVGFHDGTHDHLVGGPGEACLGIANFLNALWGEVGEIQDSLRVPEPAA